jgi:hypothetical protein
VGTSEKFAEVIEDLAHGLIEAKPLEPTQAARKVLSNDFGNEKAKAPHERG